MHKFKKGQKVYKFDLLRNELIRGKIEDIKEYSGEARLERPYEVYWSNGNGGNATISWECYDTIFPTILDAVIANVKRHMLLCEAGVRLFLVECQKQGWLK